MFKLAVILLSLSASTLATLFTTSPVAATSWRAGDKQTISWQESTDAAKPTLSDFGEAKISIYVGNAQQQTSLQVVSASTDVSKVSSIEFTPDPAIGRDGNFYFVRFEALRTPDPTNPNFPALAFSAKFTMTGMRGTFAPEVQAQIDGASTAPIGGAAPTVASSPSAGAGASATTTRAAAATAAGASRTTSAAATTSTKKSGADHSLRFSSFAVAGAAAVLGVALY